MALLPVHGSRNADLGHVKRASGPRRRRPSSRFVAARAVAASTAPSGSAGAPRFIARQHASGRHRNRARAALRSREHEHVLDNLSDARPLGRHLAPPADGPCELATTHAQLRHGPITAKHFCCQGAQQDRVDGLENGSRVDGWQREPLRTGVSASSNAKLAAVARTSRNAVSRPITCVSSMSRPSVKVGLVVSLTVWEPIRIVVLDRSGILGSSAAIASVNTFEPIVASTQMSGRGPFTVIETQCSLSVRQRI